MSTVSHHAPEVPLRSCRETRPGLASADRARRRRRVGPPARPRHRRRAGARRGAPAVDGAAAAAVVAYFTIESNILVLVRPPCWCAIRRTTAHAGGCSGSPPSAGSPSPGSCTGSCCARCSTSTAPTSWPTGCCTWSSPSSRSSAGCCSARVRARLADLPASGRVAVGWLVVMLCPAALTGWFPTRSWTTACTGGATSRSSVRGIFVLFFALFARCGSTTGAARPAPVTGS